MSKNHKIAAILYVSFFILAVLYVRSVLKTDYIDIKEEQKKEKVADVKPVTVKLQVIMPSGLTQNYTLKSTNSETVEYLMSKLRDQGFTFEKMLYTYGTEISIVNKVEAPANFKWRIFDGDTDITQQFNDYKLKDNTIYTVKVIEQNAR